MATVPGPNPDKPLPEPGAPARKRPSEPEEEPRKAAEPDRGDRPDWMPSPYHPDREHEEPGVPVAP